MKLAVATVHTTGVNWESVSVIVALVTVLMTVVLWIISRRDRRQQQENQAVKQEIADAINHQSEVLLAKLETKDTVARISERLAAVEAALRRVA